MLICAWLPIWSVYRKWLKRHGLEDGFNNGKGSCASLVDKTTIESLKKNSYHGKIGVFMMLSK